MKKKLKSSRKFGSQKGKLHLHVLQVLQVLQAGQWGSVTGVTGVIGWTVVQCYRRYRLDSGVVVQRDSGTVGQLYSVTKKSSELAKPHSYWVF